MTLASRVVLGDEWFDAMPVPLEEINKLMPLLTSEDREEYQRGWLCLMLKSLRCADPDRQPEGEEWVFYLAEQTRSMTEDEYPRSIHTVLKLSYGPVN